MSDFNYHNLGIPDFGPGMDGNGIDYGRYDVTGKIMISIDLEHLL